MLKNLFKSIYEWTNFYLDHCVLPQDKQDRIRTFMDNLYFKATGEKYE